MLRLVITMHYDDEVKINNPDGHKIAIHSAKSYYPPGTTMLATSKNALFPSHNHLLTTGTGWSSGDNQSVGSSVPVVSRWL